MMIKLTKNFLLAISLLVALWVPQSINVHAADSANATQRSMNWLMTGPMGGDVRSLVIDPQDPQRLYISTLDGQIYTSTDGGQRWARLAGFNYPGLYIDHLIVDPRDSKTIYVAAHRHKEPGGFFKSTDGGATWRE